MNSVLMISVVLAMPPAIAERAPQPLTVTSVRAAYATALQKSAKRAKPKLPVVVPQLVKVYTDLEKVEGMSHRDRSRMQGILEGRMEELRNQLIRQVLKDRKLARQKSYRNRNTTRRTTASDEKADLLAGGGANAQAVQLIDLIQNTIEPDSWQRAGGQGTISYFSLLHALVIRQTGEVHHQIGGTLGQLKK